MHTSINCLFRKILYGFMLLGAVISLLGINGSPIARAQGAGSSGPGRPHRLPNGKWFIPDGPQGQMRVGAQNVTPLTSSGGPDDFGYTWNDTGIFSWIDTTSGTDTHMTGYSDNQAVGAVALPFSFKYYENTYTSLYIAASGYLSFTDNNGYWPDQDPIPNPISPNNVIAPYWSPFNIGTGSWVHYMSGGSAPNRYFVVEWHNLTDSASNTFRFEVILQENGNIRFQYQTMPLDMYFCAGMGIEDSIGQDGLTYMPFCDTPPSSGTMVTFYRPAPSARVRIWPSNQGLFTSPGALESFQVSIYNIGELGTDTYDLTLSSTWTASLYAADGVTLLTDTNHDGIVDTGSAPQGGQVTITIKMQTPGGAVVGDANSASLTARSSVDTSKSRTATLHTAVPTPFAQIYRDNADGAMSLYLVQPGAQAVKKVTADNYYGYDMAVTETPSGNFVYTWDIGGCLDSYCDIYVDEIEYTILDHDGNTVRAVSKLTDNSGATMGTYDSSPSVTVAPDGHIGVLWSHQLYNSSTYHSNSNIYFATLDGSGNLLSGPTNVTNNAVWGIYGGDLNIPELFSPTIAATDDNRFILSWNDERQVNAFSWSENIWYATRDTAGASVFAPAALTSDNNSWTPILNSLAGGNTILTWNKGCVPTYAVLNSGGTVSKAATSLGVSDVCGSSDAVLLPNGKVTVAWGTYTGIQFDILDASYNLIVGPVTLDNPAATIGNDYISVTADSANHTILTWMDASWPSYQNLYYALVDGTGSVLTSPMIYRHGQGSSPYIETSFNGQGNVPNQIVYISGNAGVAGAILNYTGGSTVANGSGNYTISVLNSWSGTVTPSKMCYNFSPINRSYINVLADQSGQNYTATAFPTCWMIYLPLVIR